MKEHKKKVKMLQHWIGMFVLSIVLNSLFQPDGGLLATGSYDGIARLWNERGITYN